jgi:hypothetical protein
MDEASGWHGIDMKYQAPRLVEMRSRPRIGLYCCLMAHALKSENETETYVFVSANPVLSTILHNRRETSTKDTRGVAPYWYLAFVAGPFPLALDAYTFAQQWVDVTRGCTSKIKRGTEMASDAGVPFYSKRIRPNVRGRSTLAYLRLHGPPDYVRTYLKRRKRPNKVKSRLAIKLIKH